MFWKFLKTSCFLLWWSNLTKKLLESDFLSNLLRGLKCFFELLSFSIRFSIPSFSAPGAGHRFSLKERNWHLGGFYQLATEIDVKTKLLERGGGDSELPYEFCRLAGSSVWNWFVQCKTTYKAKHYFCSKEFKKRITTRGIFDPLPGEVVSLSHPPHPGHLSSSWFKATALICFHFLFEKFAFSALLCFSERAEARFYFWHMIVSSRHTTQLELSFEHSV